MRRMNSYELVTCTSCYGEGEINTDSGPYLCKDCQGNGRILPTGEQIEERIREIEVEMERHPHEVKPETRWLVFELRRTRKLLWQIRSYCEEARATPTTRSSSRSAISPTGPSPRGARDAARDAARGRLMPGSAGGRTVDPGSSACPALARRGVFAVPALYPALLGAAWAALAPPVQRLHAGGARARGRFRVRRGRGLAARLVAGLLRMPEAAEDIAGDARRRAGGRRRQWLRPFGARPLFSSQWRSGDLLVEGLDLVQCWFRLRAEGGARVRAGAVDARAHAASGCGCPDGSPRGSRGGPEPLRDEVHVDVRIFAPVAGLLVAYEGRGGRAGGEAPLLAPARRRRRPRRRRRAPRAGPPRMITALGAPRRAGRARRLRHALLPQWRARLPGGVPGTALEPSRFGVRDLLYAVLFMPPCRSCAGEGSAASARGAAPRGGSRSRSAISSSRTRSRRPLGGVTREGG